MTEVARGHSTLATHKFVFIGIFLAALWWIIEVSIHVLFFTRASNNSLDRTTMKPGCVLSS